LVVILDSPYHSAVAGKDQRKKIRNLIPSADSEPSPAFGDVMNHARTVRRLIVDRDVRRKMEFMTKSLAKLGTEQTLMKDAHLIFSSGCEAALPCFPVKFAADSFLSGYNMRSYFL
jgi:hypothetical protein